MQQHLPPTYGGEENLFREGETGLLLTKKLALNSASPPAPEIPSGGSLQARAQRERFLRLWENRMCCNSINEEMSFRDISLKVQKVAIGNGVHPPLSTKYAEEEPGACQLPAATL
jgi:hypothetical protein